MHCAQVASSPVEADDAVRRIAGACRSAAAGRLAERALVAWVRGRGVSETEFRLLWALAHGASSTESAPLTLNQRELASLLAVSPAQVSGAVERLESRQLIERIHDREDRRRHLWALTARGTAVVEEVVAAAGTASESIAEQQDRAREEAA